MPRPYNLLIDKNKKRFFTKRRGIDSLSLDGNRGSENQTFFCGNWWVLSRPTSIDGMLF